MRSWGTFYPVQLMTLDEEIMTVTTQTLVSGGTCGNQNGRENIISFLQTKKRLIIKQAILLPFSSWILASSSGQRKRSVV